MRRLTVLMAILALPACTAMLLGNHSSRETAPTTSTMTSKSSADSSISASIRRQYEKNAGISQYSIGIRTSAGRVTLSGIVGSYDVRDDVVDIARNTHGVVSVDSRVTVNTNSP
jgi:osmotically-inducible protein OsmY